VSGIALSATTGEAHAAIEMVARRFGVLNSHESLNLSNMREMESRIGAARGVQGSPSSSRLQRARCSKRAARGVQGSPSSSRLQKARGSK